MKKMILTIDNDFAKAHFLDMEELKLFKDIPSEIITKVILNGIEMDVAKVDLARKDKKGKISVEEKEKFITDYMKNKALLSMFAIAHAVSNVKIDDIEDIEDID